MGKKSAAAHPRIPEEIIFDILTRLPVKSLARFRCVSKRWSSMIASQPFINSHMNRSSSRPGVLIAFPSHDFKERFLFPSDHPEDYPGQDLPPFVTDYHLTVPGCPEFSMSQSLNGLVLLRGPGGPRICNPSTREFFRLPGSEASTRPHPGPDYTCFVRWIFGYDPVNNEHKALETNMYSSRELGETVSMEQYVFVLGTHSWRRIENGTPHFPSSDGICINGTLYYKSYAFVVAFDVRLETSRVMDLPFEDKCIFDNMTMIDYEGGLGIVRYDDYFPSDVMDLWVLEDPDEGGWLRRTLVALSPWSSIIGDEECHVAGTIHTGELIVAPRSLCKPFYVYYYDMKKNSTRKVEIEGLPDYGVWHHYVYGDSDTRVNFTSHAESIVSIADLCN